MCRGWEGVYHSLDIFHQFLWSYWSAKLWKKEVKLINGLFHVVAIFAKIELQVLSPEPGVWEEGFGLGTTKALEGKLELERLRLLGNFHHNIQGLETHCGELIVMRYTTGAEVISTEEFQPCTHCYGFLQHNELIGSTLLKDLSF